MITIPFPALRHIEVLPAFSRAKQKAIRQLTYDASAKIFLRFVGDFGKRTKESSAAPP